MTRREPLVVGTGNGAGSTGWLVERENLRRSAVYEGDLVNYALFQGSVEIFRWLMEEKGWELNVNTGWWVGLGGSVKVLEYIKGRGYEFDEGACEGAAMGGCLQALKFLRGLDPPCPWDEMTCWEAAWEGHLDVLKWLRDHDPPCPWGVGTCKGAAKGGYLEILKWARSQDPPCPWMRHICQEEARKSGHQHVVDWIDQREDESDVYFSDLEYSGSD